MALRVLASNTKRMMRILGAAGLMQAIRVLRPELGGQLADTARTVRESENQLPPLGVAESFKSEIGKCGRPIA